MTACILGALVIGKLLGIMLLVLVASRVHCAPLNPKIRPADVAMVASTASVGLTVALFVAGARASCVVVVTPRPDLTCSPRASISCVPYGGGYTTEHARQGHREP